MSGSLWTPYDQEREQVVERQVHAGIYWAQQITRELKKLDPYLDLVFIGDRAPEYPGLVPGRWHVRRRNPDTLDHYLPLTGQNGEFVQPGMWLVEEMKKRDLWNEGSIREMMRRQVRASEDRKKKDKALLREQRRDEAAVSVRAAKRVAGEGGMTKRAWGRGRVKGVVGS